jgi:hypothetical protein
VIDFRVQIGRKPRTPLAAADGIDLAAALGMGLP